MPRFSYGALRRHCPALALPPRALAGRLARWGFPVDSCERRAGDWLLSLDIPYGRPDCLSHRGLARDLASLLGLEPAADPPPEPAAREAGVVALRGRPGSFRLTRALRLAAAGASLPEHARRIRALGGSHFSRLWDAVELARQESRQPLWALDADRLRGALVLRRARRGERLEHSGGRAELGPEDWVVADAAGPVALPGLAEGRPFQIGRDTRRAVLGGALLPAAELLRCGTRHGIEPLQGESEADARELELALEAALRLLREPGGAGPLEAAGAPWRAGPCPRERSCVFSARELEDRLGVRLGARRLRALLAPLGRLSGPDPRLRLRTERRDLRSGADVAAELARRLGHEALAAPPPRAARAGALAGATRALRRLQDGLERAGFAELMHYDFGPAEAPEAGALRVRDPAEPGRALALRADLLPALLRRARERRRGREQRLYECGRAYRRAGKRVEESSELCGLWVAPSQTREALARRCRELLDGIGGAHARVSTPAFPEPAAAFRLTLERLRA